MPVVCAFALPHPPLVVPEVGGGQERMVQSTVEAFGAAARRIAEAKPETVVVITPHNTAYADYIHLSPGESASGDFSQFGARHVKMDKAYDSALVSRIAEFAFEADVSAGTMGEKSASLDHGTMVPLYYLDKELSDYQVVRVSQSGLPYLTHYRLGQCIAQAADDLGRRIAVIGSGDLSHKLKDSGPYGYAKEGPRFDDALTDVLHDADFLKLMQFDEHFCNSAAECGLKSFIMMAGALDGKAVDVDFLSYEGPFGVGYAVCGYTVEGEDENRHFGDRLEAAQKKALEETHAGEDEYVRLARLSLETYVKTGEYAKMPAGLPGEMTARKAGVFVSIKKHGRLRGCIGTTAPTQDSVAEEIVKNAVSAGTGDPRFDPITEDELMELVYSVDVLGKPEDIGGKDELDVRKYGVIVRKGFRSGLLLPNLEGIDTVDEQVDIARQKAGIARGAEVQLQRFEVVRHK